MTLQVNQQLRQGHLEAAFKAYHEMVKQGFVPKEDTMNKLFHTAARQNDLPRVNELLSDLKEHRHRVSFTNFAAIINGFCVALNLPTATTFYERLKSSGLPMTAAPVASLISCAGRLNQPDEALRFFAEADEYRFSLRRGALNSVLRVLFRSKRYQEIIDFYHQHMENKCPADVITVNILFNSYTALRRHGDALDVLNIIKQHRVKADAKMLHSMLVLALQREDKLRLIELLQLIEAPDMHTRDLFSCNMLIKSYSSLRDLPKALGVFEEMTARGVDPNHTTFQYLIECCKFSRHLPQGVKLFEQMKQRGITPTIITATKMVDIFCILEQPDRALAVFSDLKLSGQQPSHITYNILIRGLIRNNEVDKAFSILAEMKDCGLQPNVSTHNNIIDGFKSIGNAAEAINYYESHSLHFQPNSATFGVLLDACVLTNDLARALNLLEQMRESEIPIVQKVYCDLITLCGQFNQFSSARLLWTELKTRNLSPTLPTLHVMIDLARENHQFELLKELESELKTIT